MNQRQQREVEILTRLEAGAVDVSTAAELVGVGPRQVRRLRARFRERGFAAVIHGNQGRSPTNRTDPALLERILALAGPGGKYHDLNICHLQERLQQVDLIPIGRSTLDRLLKQAGLRQKASKSAPPLHRRRRPRRPAEGMLLQVDGSPFPWLQGQGSVVLLGAIDDATGKILFLLFRPSEDQIGYLLLLRTIAQGYGLPMSIYHDRHTLLRSPKQPTLEEELAGQTPLSQIQRVMAELGIESIPAHSPQAKGGRPRRRRSPAASSLAAVCPSAPSSRYAAAQFRGIDNHPQVFLPLQLLHPSLLQPLDQVLSIQLRTLGRLPPRHPPYPLLRVLALVG